MPIVSIDLASRRWADIGIAVLDGDLSSVTVELIDAGLQGRPTPEGVRELALHWASSLILIDGPQAWRANSSDFVHTRLCERRVHAPGKTGLPGVVKPATWTSMATFSIALFDQLDAAGWPRFPGSWPVPRATIESFPTHAWRALGHRALPAKHRRPDLGHWMDFLSERFDIAWPRRPTHDQLQAVVAGLAGIAIQCGGLDACEIHGSAPIIEDGIVREGYIVSPRAIPRGSREPRREPASKHPSRDR